MKAGPYNAHYFRNRLNDYRRLTIMRILQECKDDGLRLTVEVLHTVFNEVLKTDFCLEPMDWPNFMHMWHTNCEGAWDADAEGGAIITEMGSFRLKRADVNLKTIEMAILLGVQRGEIQRARVPGKVFTQYWKLAPEAVTTGTNL